MAAILVIIAITVLSTIGLVELLGLLSSAESQATGIPASIQVWIGSFREILGIVVLAVFAGLLFATFKVFQKD